MYDALKQGKSTNASLVEFDSEQAIICNVCVCKISRYDILQRSFLEKQSNVNKAERIAHSCVCVIGCSPCYGLCCGTLTVVYKVFTSPSVDQL